MVMITVWNVPIAAVIHSSFQLTAFDSRAALRYDYDTLTVSSRVTGTALNCFNEPSEESAEHSVSVLLLLYSSFK